MTTPVEADRASDDPSAEGSGLGQHLVDEAPNVGRLHDVEADQSPGDDGPGEAVGGELGIDVARQFTGGDRLERAGRRADGWTPSGLPLDAAAAMWSVVTAAAEAAGRDASALSLVVRANIKHTARPIDGERPKYQGSVEQIAEDVRGAFAIGAHQVILDLQGTTTTVAEYLELADAIVAAGELRTAA